MKVHLVTNWGKKFSNLGGKRCSWKRNEEGTAFLRPNFNTVIGDQDTRFESRPLRPANYFPNDFSHIFG